jgi:hypothetical protein
VDLHRLWEKHGSVWPLRVSLSPAVVTHSHTCIYTHAHKHTHAHARIQTHTHTQGLGALPDPACRAASCGLPNHHAPGHAVCLCASHRVLSGSFTLTHHTRALPCDVFELGGSRKERYKWVRCFDSMEVVVFVVDIAAYASRLFQDESINALAHAHTHAHARIRAHARTHTHTYTHTNTQTQTHTHTHTHTHIQTQT